MPLLIGLQELIRSWRENEQDQPPRGWRGLIKQAAALGKEAPNGLLAPRSLLRSLSQRSPRTAPALRLLGSQRDTTCGTGGAGGTGPVCKPGEAAGCRSGPARCFWQLAPPAALKQAPSLRGVATWGTRAGTQQCPWGLHCWPLN